MPPILGERLKTLRKLTTGSEESGDGTPEDVERIVGYLASNGQHAQIEWSDDLEKIVRKWVHADDPPRIGAYKTYLTIDDWAVQSIVAADQEIARVLRVPANAVAARVPSAGEEILLAAFLYCDQAAFTELSIGLGQIVIQWLQGGTPNVDLEAFVATAVGAITRSEDSHIVSTTKAPQLELSAALLDKPASELKFMGEIYRSIAVAGELRWQYLSVYRIFEHAWLRTIHNALTKTFMQNPDEAIKSALDALTSERAQFENTVAQHDLKAEFTTLHDKFSELLTTNNRFCHAIKKRVGDGASKKKKSGNTPGQAHDGTKAEESGKALEKWRLGVRICYQIRCAIVHAGASGVYYENFDDADEAVRELLSQLELAMQKFTGIREVST